MIYGYARISPGNQDRKAQVDALKRAGARQIFSDKIRSCSMRRPQLRRLVSALQKGDTVLVTQVGRLANSMVDLIFMMSAIRERGGNFRSLSEPWANVDAEMGEFILRMLAGVAALERGFLQMRMAEGRARAKATGKCLGRSPLLSPEQGDAVRDMLKAGQSMRSVAGHFNVGVTTIWRLAHAAEVRGG